MSLRVHAGRGSTAQSLLLEIVRAVENGDFEDIVIYEYPKDDLLDQNERTIQSTHYIVNPGYIKTLASKVRTNNVDWSGLNVRQLCIEIESKIKIPNLPIPVKDGALDFSKFDCEVIKLDDLKNRSEKLRKTLIRRNEEIVRRTGAKIPISTVNIGINARIEVLKAAIYTYQAKQDAIRPTLLQSLYSAIAAREREVLLYLSRPNVKWKISHDENIISTIDEIIRCFGGYHPFQDIGTGTNSSFKVENFKNDFYDE